MTATEQTPYWQQPVSIAELISETLDWATRNPDVASPRLDRLEDMLPSGSGIDSGTKIDREDTAAPSSETFQLSGSWHAMDEGGYYAGWFYYIVIVRSTFSGPGVEIVWHREYPGQGDDDDGVSDPTDYLADVYRDAMRETCTRADID